MNFINFLTFSTCGNSENIGNIEKHGNIDDFKRVSYYRDNLNPSNFPNFPNFLILTLDDINENIDE